MEFSVVIPTHRRVAKLQRCIGALAAQRGAPTFEVIIVFDGPEPEAEEQARCFGARHGLALIVISQLAAGPAAARNRGARAARGHRILFIGDDIIPTPTLLAEHHRAAQAELASGRGEAAVLGLVEWAAESRPTRFMRFLAPECGPQFHYGMIANPSDCGFEFCYTANFAVPRAWWAREPFDEDFRHAACEDTEWAWRMEQHGARIVYDPAALAHHDHHVTLRQFMRRQQVAGRAAALVYAKQPAMRRLGGLFPPTRHFFFGADGRSPRDRLRQLRILARHYAGLPVRSDDYWWLLIRPYLGALTAALAERGIEYIPAESQPR